MFEQEKRELLDLFLRVQEETNAYMSVRYCTGAITDINIQDNGFDSEGEIDGAYCIYNDPKLADKSAENYEKAKEHILRLLENGRCPVSAKTLEVCAE